MWTTGPLPARVALVALIAGIPVPLRAQSDAHWRVFTSSEGLRESWVENATPGADGRLWITHGGVDALTLSDGYRFRHLPTPGTSLTVREGSGGQVWALQRNPSHLDRFDGVQLLQDDRWVAFPIEGLAAAGMSHHHFLPWREDRVLLLHEHALMEFDRAQRSVRPVQVARETPLRHFTDIAPARDGGVWIGGPGGLLRLSAPDRSDEAPAPVEHPLPAAWPVRRLLKIHEGGEGQVFASAELEDRWALLRSDAGGWQEVARTSSPLESIEGWQGAGRATWFATMTARTFQLHVLTPDGRRLALDRAKALSGRLQAVHPLEDGTAWLATSVGLVRHAEPPWRTPLELSSIAGHVGALYESAAGDLYALHESSLLRRTGGRWERIDIPPPHRPDVGVTDNIGALPDGRVVFGVNRSDDALVIGGDAMLVFDPEGSTLRPLVHPAGRTVRLLAARDGLLWVVTGEGAARRLETYDGRRFSVVLEGPPGWFTAPPRMLLDAGPRGIFLVPESTRIGLLRDGRYRVLGTDEDYPGTGPFSVLALDGDRFWFGDRDGIVELDGTRWTRVRSGLQTVRSMLRASDGAVWVASGAGLHWYRDGSWIALTADDGLPGGAVNDVLEDRRGTLWVSTTAGLSHYAADADRDPPETLLDASRNPVQAPPSGDVRFVFSGRDRWDVTTANRLLYSWRLDGGPWSPLQAEPGVTFSDLRAGEHRLEVRAADRDGNVDPEPVSLAFVVLLPWYREAGFLAVASIAVIAIAGLIALAVLRQFRLERLVEERTAALAAANARLRTELEDRTRMEEERGRLERQLRQSQKLEAIGRLAGGIAHDFNNLLMVIGSYADLIRGGLQPQDPAHGAADEILKAAARASALTRQLLAFSRHQVVQPAVLDLNEVVVDIQRMLRRVIGEDIDLRFVPGDAAWPVLADRGQIEQVILNLVVNARDAMPRGGRLTIALSNVEVDAAFARARTDLTPGPYVRLAVSDTGVGMDEETRSRVFEPFFTTKVLGQGSGLGLATVYGIVKRAGGQIVVDSEPGKGSTFSVYLPRTERTRPPVREGAPGGDAPRGTETILLVEDEEAVRELVAAVLRGLGYTVLEAESGEEAEDIVRRENGAMDLILSDVVLSGISGPQLVARLRGSYRSLRAIFMSGYVDEAAVRDGTLPGDVPFIQKPFSPAALARKVREVIDAPPGIDPGA